MGLIDIGPNLTATIQGATTAIAVMGIAWAIAWGNVMYQKYTAPKKSKDYQE